jgi:hypothetical protein
MSTQVWRVIWHYDEMEDAGEDGQVATGAGVGLARRVWLHRRDGHPEKIAHARTAKIATRATTITTMSVTSLS